MQKLKYPKAKKPRPPKVAKIKPIGGFAKIKAPKSAAPKLVVGGTSRQRKKPIVAL